MPINILKKIHTHTHTQTYIHTHTHTNTVLEAENIANVEMTKITTWANANKIQFNERKSKVLLLTKR